MANLPLSIQNLVDGFNNNKIAPKETLKSIKAKANQLLADSRKFRVKGKLATVKSICDRYQLKDLRRKDTWKKIYSHLVWLRMGLAIKSFDYEIALFVSLDGEVLCTTQYIKDEVDMTEFNNVIDSKKFVPLLFTHNHPSSFSLSYDDLKFADWYQQYGLIRIAAVTREGSLHEFTLNDSISVNDLNLIAQNHGVAANVLSKRWDKDFNNGKVATTDEDIDRASTFVDRYHWKITLGLADTPQVEYRAYQFC